MSNPARPHTPERAGVLGVGAILYTADGRYLMQLRDDAPHVSMKNHWGLFGGIVEQGERPERALVRELIEELAYEVKVKPARFTDLRYSLEFAMHGIHRKVFYSLEVTNSDLAAMRLGEGQEMRLFTPARILALSNVVPWDAFGVRMFAARDAIRANLRRTVGSISRRRSS